MRADEIRFLFAYDRWAARRVLNALDGLDPAVWARTDVVGDRGRGSILVHQLGSSQRWRILFEGRATNDMVRAELEPLPTIDELRARWEAEWAAVDAWLQTSDGRLRRERARRGAGLAAAGPRRESRNAAPGGGGGAPHRLGAIARGA
jgi:hypothetical protein